MSGPIKFESSASKKLQEIDRFMKKWNVAVALTLIVGVAILLGVDLGGKFSFFVHKTFAVSTLGCAAALITIPNIVWGILDLYYSRKHAATLAHRQAGADAAKAFEDSAAAIDALTA